jgi:hypothetical protein
MSDARRDSKSNQIRFKISGGLQDIEDARDLLKEEYSSLGWDVNWYKVKPRGDFGPLHDLEIGFIQSI